MKTKRVFTTCLLLMLAVLFIPAIETPVFADDNSPVRDNFFKTEFVYEAKVLIDPERPVIGDSKYGKRTIVWITGGTFKGPDMEGTVIPGGADWQLVRADGAKELDARYALKTNDGVIIYIKNQVLTRPQPTKDNPDARYARSVISFEAPLNSKYKWLNDYIYLGTLERAPDYDENPAVIIRVWKVL
jgi:hypothetical protein